MENGAIVPIRLSIVDLEGVPVQVPTVTIDLIKLSSGELMIAKVDTIPFEETPGQECTNAFCRAKAIAISHLREMMEGAKGRLEKAGKLLGMKGKGCGASRGPSAQRKPGHRVHPHEHGERPYEHEERPHHEHPHEQGDHPHHEHEGHPHAQGERPHHGPDGHPHEESERPHGHGDGPHAYGDRIPHHHHPHMHAHGHGRHNKIHRFIHRATHLFIIPALLGVVGGLTASAIGMVVGQTIVSLWFRFVRGGRRGNVSSARVNETGIEEEKEALVGEEEDETLPPYEEAQTAADEKN